MKYILLNYRNQATTVLVRASDGMMVGSCAANRVIYGENPNASDFRLFIDRDHALRFLKEVVAGAGAEFEEREGDSRIVMPDTGIGLPH